MSFLLGENVNIGVGFQDDREVAVAPQAWLPARTPTGVGPALEKTLVKETRGNRMSSEGSVITQARAEGDLEFNIRNGSIGYILKSLLGGVVSAVKGGETVVYEHDFTIDVDSPQHPALTIALSQLSQQCYEYLNALVTSLEISTPVDDLATGNASMLAKSEAEHAAYTPAFADNDYYFRNHDITFKIADDVAGLATADELKVKEFSLSINNNGRVNQNISDYNPDEVLGLLFEITGSMSLDYTGKDYHDIFTSGAYKAMEIKMVRSDITIGTSSNPEITITLPKVSFENYSADRPIDDIVMENFDFTCHYDDDAANGISINVVNEVEDYEPASGS